MIETETIRRQELSEFLKSRRARLRPAPTGSTRRRTPGLRREEVAQLAGVGVTWYTWFEQGRDISVSDEVLEGIAVALRLTPSETHHLFALAKRHLPLDLFHQEEYVSPAMEALLDHQGVMPAFIIGRYWDILAWNPAAGLLLGGLDHMPAAERHHVRHMFLNPLVRQCLVDWESHAQRMVAEFRVSYGRHIEDARFTAVVEDLKKASPEFCAWWPRHEVVGRRNVYKTFVHPALGRLEFEQTTLLVSDAPDLKLIIKIPLPGTPTQRLVQEMLAVPPAGDHP